MSSLSKAKNGSWRLQVKCPDNVRRDAYFRCNKKTATTLKNKIDEMVRWAHFHLKCNVADFSSGSDKREFGSSSLRARESCFGRR